MLSMLPPADPRRHRSQASRADHDGAPIPGHKLHVRDLLDIGRIMCESLKSLERSRIYMYRHSNTLSNSYPTPGARRLVELRDMETMILEGRHEVLTGKIM
jgi:hypothetical protein